MGAGKHFRTALKSTQVGGGGADNSANLKLPFLPSRDAVLTDVWLFNTASSLTQFSCTVVGTKAEEWHCWELEPFEGGFLGAAGTPVVDQEFLYLCRNSDRNSGQNTKS